MRLSGHTSLLSFQSQQEQTVFIRQEVGKAVARVRKKNTQAKGQCVCTPNLKYRKIRMCCPKKVFHISKYRSDIQQNSGGGEGAAYSGDLQRPLPPKPPSSSKIVSQGDAHVRTDAQIKFLYYPLRTLIQTVFHIGDCFWAQQNRRLKK